MDSLSAHYPRPFAWWTTAYTITFLKGRIVVADLEGEPLFYIPWSAVRSLLFYSDKLRFSLGSSKQRFWVYFHRQQEAKSVEERCVDYGWTRPVDGGCFDQLRTLVKVNKYIPIHKPDCKGSGNLACYDQYNFASTLNSSQTQYWDIEEGKESKQ